MEIFEPRILLSVATLLEDLGSHDTKLPDTQTTLKSLKMIRFQCKELGLRFTLKEVDRAIGMLEEPPPLHVFAFKELCCNVRERLEDELDDVHLMVLSPKGAERYSRWNEGWEPVMDRFPAAIDDIEEASKTLALHRATACVFHLMRVMEVGLKAVSRALGIPYAPSWESYLRQIKANVDKDWKDKDAEWRAREPFFRDALALLFAVKVAWRNPTMHIVSHYTSEQAEDILNAVRGFMRHISTELAFNSEIPA